MCWLEVQGWRWACFIHCLSRRLHFILFDLTDKEVIPLYKLFISDTYMQYIFINTHLNMMHILRKFPLELELLLSALILI
jgi:hypothetical protein